MITILVTFLLFGVPLIFVVLMLIIIGFYDESNLDYADEHDSWSLEDQERCLVGEIKDSGW